MIRYLLLIGVATVAAWSHAGAEPYRNAWRDTPDRVWLGRETWANSMEDWAVRDGAAVCLRDGKNRNVALLTRELEPERGTWEMRVRIDNWTGGSAGSAGFRIGIRDSIPDYRAAALRGKGLDGGVTARGRLFFGTPPKPTTMRQGLDRRAWSFRYVSSTQGGQESPAKALDGDPDTFWHSRHVTEPYPHELQLDLGREETTTGLGYLPRQDSTSGHFRDYEVYLSRDGDNWGSPVAAGAFRSQTELQGVAWEPTTARYLRVVMKTSHQTRPAATIAELFVYSDAAGPAVRPDPEPAHAGPWILTLRGIPGAGGTTVRLDLAEADTGRHLAQLEKTVVTEQIRGLVGLVHETAGREAARFGFSGWRIEGEAVRSFPDRAWGPILWAMHSLSHSRGADGHILNLTAQLAPLGKHDPRTVALQIQRGATWETVDTVAMDPAARTARFRMPRWPADHDVPYRLVYPVPETPGTEPTQAYHGVVRRDPIDRPLVIAGFTGNTDYVFPNLEVARSVETANPDVLFFSGDQIYEGVGGYGIHRTPADVSTLNYLRKWYLLGWAFGDLMRDRVTLCLPDDHDVYQGNIWGEGGIDCGGIQGHDAGGYAQPVEMINAVHRTQTSHHPDAYDPTPIDRGISVFYGDMVYGRVSFAVLADRMFKSGPKGKVDTGSGRADHVMTLDLDVATLDRPGLHLLGERQEAFLEAWAADWRQADLKVVLSQTIFCNLANYHGPSQTFIVADLDSNGWPQSGRNRALDLMRRGFAFHLAGDQHLASIVHHGIDVHGDAGWSFCVPSIAAGYPRSWRPDQEERPVRNRPAPGLANTGDYRDGLGNAVSVYAVGNPKSENRTDTPAILAHDKASGFGIVRLDQRNQTITMECWRLLADLAAPKPEDQFPGWPRTLQLWDNDGREAYGFLPALSFAPEHRPVVQVVDESSGKILYTVRVNQSTFRPQVFRDGRYTVLAGDPDRGDLEVVHRNVRPVGTGIPQAGGD